MTAAEPKDDTRDIEKAIRARLPSLAPLKATAKLDMGPDGILLLNARRASPTLSRRDAAADCTFRISAANMRKLLAGTLNPVLALALGKIKVAGDREVARRLGELLRT